MFKPIARRSLSRSVFDQLVEQILRGSLSPGDSLPGERSLSERLGVNRGAIREALKRLEQARLVAIQQGGATTVLNYLKTAGLDLFAQLVLTEDGRVDTLAVRSLIELRTALGPDIARRCARRHSAVLAEALSASLRAFVDAPSVAARQRESFALWQRLIEGSDNLSYQLAFNTVKTVWAMIDQAMIDVMHAELQAIEAHEALVDAVLARDEERAAALARELLMHTENAVVAVFGPCEGDGSRYRNLDSITRGAQS